MHWIKALHIISIVVWFAGLFYLPRLFVYHSMTEDQIGNDRFKIMERKLYYGIMTPGLIFTLLSGHWLITFDLNYLHQLWLQIKLILVFSLVIFHVYCGYLVYIFKKDQNKHSHIFYRWLNEYPTIILIAVVILAEVKPFLT